MSDIQEAAEPPVDPFALIALDFINEHRRSIGQAPLDPVAAGWTHKDLVAEITRIRRLKGMTTNRASNQSEGELKTLRTMVKRLQKIKPAPKPVQVIERRFDKPPGADAALFENDDGFLILVQPGLPLPRLEERLIHEWAHLHDQCGKRPCGHNSNWGGNYADTYRLYHRTKNSRDQPAAKRARVADHVRLKRRLMR